MSENVYYDALTALGLMIAFYYGLTGYASAIYYRKVLFRSVKDFVGMGVLPLAGGVMLTWAFVQSIIDLADPTELVHVHRSGGPGDLRQLFGIGVPLAISIIFLVLGFVLMIAWWIRNPSFFRWKPETFDPDVPPADSFAG